MGPRPSTSFLSNLRVFLQTEQKVHMRGARRPTSGDVRRSTLHRVGQAPRNRWGFSLVLNAHECSSWENHSVGNSLPRPFSLASSYTLAPAAEN
jgi:hypothetical protein